MRASPPVLPEIPQRITSIANHVPFIKRRDARIKSRDDVDASTSAIVTATSSWKPAMNSISWRPVGAQAGRIAADKHQRKRTRTDAAGGTRYFKRYTTVVS